MKCSSTKLGNAESTQRLTFQLEYLKRFLQCLCIVTTFNSSFGQNVGIGIDMPTQKLEVAGNIKGTNFYSTGKIGIGTTTPGYKLHLFDGAFGVSNTADNVTWAFGYEPFLDGFGFAYNGVIRFTLLNSGNIHVESNAVIDGNVTVNNGRGILQNSQGAGQLKYYTRTASFATSLNGFALSSEQAIGFTSGIFSSPPKVFVGDIVSTGGTAGELYRVQLIIYDVTTTGCKARLLNTSPNFVSYTTTWNIVCIGE